MSTGAGVLLERFVLLDRYCRWCAATAQHAESTITLRRSYLRRLCEAMDPLTCTDEEIVAWLSTHDWCAETRRAVRMSLLSFFSWLVERGLRLDDPMATIRPPRVPRRARRACPEATLTAARCRAVGDERLMLEIAAQIGLRRAEVASLRGDAISGDGVLTVLGKGGDERLIPVPAPLAAQILARGQGWTFPGRFPDTHITADHVGRVLSNLLGPGWTGHALRRRFATRAWRSTHDLLGLQELLGHASPATTRGYVELDMDELALLVSAAS